MPEALTKRTLLLPPLLLLTIKATNCLLFFPKGSSLGYLAAVAMPLELPNRNVYMAFNFESNYGLPANDSYYYWIDRWNLTQENVGIGNGVTNVDNIRRRSLGDSHYLNGSQSSRHSQRQSGPSYIRSAFYRSIVGYLDHYGHNGTGCLLRTICEVSASDLDAHNGLLGSLFKILFMPTTSAPELLHPLPHEIIYAAEWQGQQYDGDCDVYEAWCPDGLLNWISRWF